MIFPSRIVWSREIMASLAWGATGMQTSPVFKDRPFSEFRLTLAKSTSPYWKNNFLNSESVVFKLILDILIFMRIVLTIYSVGPFEESLMNSWPLKIRDKFMSFDSWYSCILYTDTIRQKFFFFNSKKSGALMNIPSTVLAFRRILEERSGSVPMKRSICSMVMLNGFRYVGEINKKVKDIK